MQRIFNRVVTSRVALTSPTALQLRAFAKQKKGISSSKISRSDVPHVVHTPIPDADLLPVSFEDIIRAHYRIASGIRRTHCDVSAFLSELCGCTIVLKKDFTQFTGSFKERGGRNSLMLLSDAEKAKGVITASAGNHALALAWHGKCLGIPVTCVMPSVAPMTKVEKCRKFGANIILHGAHIGEAREYALSEHKDLKYINGYNDPEIIAGAGSMGIEILEQVPDVDVIVVPVGGAGLIAGVSLAVKTLKPSVKIVGVEPDNCASYAAALAAGHPVDGFKGATLADGLAVPIVGPISFEVARRCVDHTCSVSEINIAIAVLRLVEMEKLVVEGGGATGLAALLPGGPLFGKYKGQTVVVPLCGGNIDTTVLGRVIDRGLAAGIHFIHKRFGHYMQALDISQSYTSFLLFSFYTHPP